MEEKNTCRVLMGQPEGKKSLGRTRCKGSIEADIKRNWTCGPVPV
jgi:hypothetical protein